MAINFIPNDPLALASAPMRAVTPRPDRAAGEAGFTLTAAIAEGRFAPGTPEFLFWQCREAALLAVEVWEGLNGPLSEWAAKAADRKRLRLRHDAGENLNAFYDRESLLFFSQTVAGQTRSVGASTDAVCHEAGHAFLDVIRPNLFESVLTEELAFCEAFGDCFAILVALEHRAIRSALLAQTPDLTASNFVASIAEDTADGVLRLEGPDDPNSAARSAINDFTFTLPDGLEFSGPPAQLTQDAHSFCRVFTACFFDLVREFFLAGPAHDEAALLTASRMVGRLLIDGAQAAPSAPRFFQAVGRAIALSDERRHGGAHRTLIGQVFAKRGVMLGSSSALMPKFSLAGDAPVMAAGAVEGAQPAALSKRTVADLRRRMKVTPRARLAVREIVLGTTRLLEAMHRRPVDLTGLARGLRGVMAMAPESVVVGSSGLSAAAFSALPDIDATVGEVRAFVASLVARDLIAFDAADASKSSRATHVVRTVGGKKVLTRLRFACGTFSGHGGATRGVHVQGVSTSP